MALNPRATAAEADDAPRGSGAVMIGCKAPMGVVLNLDRYVKAGDTQYVNRIEGETKVTLKGWSHPFGTQDPTQWGYRLTPVPRAFWEEWLETHKGFSMLRDGIIIGPKSDSPAENDTLGKAKEGAKIDKLFRQARIGDAPKLGDGTKIEAVPESERPQAA